MINDLNADLKEEYLRYSKTSQKPLLVSSVLFNLPYKQLDSLEVCHFISIYIRHKYGAFHSLHDVTLPKGMVSVFNRELVSSAHSGREIIKSLIDIMEEFSFFIEPFATSVYERQHRDVIRVNVRKENFFTKLINFFNKE